MSSSIMHAGSSKEISANRRFMLLLKPYWTSIVLAIVSLIILTCVNMANPILVGMVFNRVFPEKNWSLLWIVLGSYALLALLRNFLYFQSKFTAMKMGENVCFSLRTQLFERLQQMRMRFTRDHSPGKLSSKVMNDSLQIQQFIQDTMPKFIQAALLFTGLSIMIYILNWQLALASTFILPIHFLAYRHFGNKIKTASRRSRENIDLATGNIIEKMLGIEVVKGFTGEARESQAFQEAIDDSRQSQLESSRFVVLQKVCADILIGIGMMALIGFGAYQVIGRPDEQAMQSGDFIAFFWYIKLLYPTVIELMSSGGKLAKANVSIERAFDMLREDRDREPSGARWRPDMKGSIEFKNVSLSFDKTDDQDEPETEPTPATSPASDNIAAHNNGAVLKNISFKIDAGTVCAITGPSGSGKTTMVSMLPLLLEPDSGEIMIDGYEIHQIKLEYLRESIGVVFQECFLFNTTIMENLRYARPEAPPQKIIEVCEYTGADSFIRQLPKGYNSIVGESGITLSRGQKQLITLTRAVIKNPKILILDEATASIDPHLEAYVIPTILNLMKGRTTLMITHNPKLLEHADCELQLAAGRVEQFHSFRNPAKKILDKPSGSNLEQPPSGRGMASKTVLTAACLLSFVLAILPARLPADEGIPLHQLSARRVQLSYIDPERCASMLQLYGFNVTQPGSAVDRNQLPAIVVMPSTSYHNALPNLNANFPMTESDPIGNLMVFYHPDHPEQLGQVLHRIHSEIDIPARQIMLEAMVLEISESSLKRLGVEWELDNPIQVTDLNLQLTELRLGRIMTQVDDQLMLGAGNVFNDFNLRLRALVREGEAEVLSRPSILTLDNRMAFINVSENIPVAHSRFHSDGRVQTVDFREREAGIQLAIRPRINDNGQEVSLQINANVSAPVPGKDVEVRDHDNRLLASSPTISVREVKTYARIANNTPFIIGGLISRDDTVEYDRVPILGAIPFFGKAFRSETAREMKREVIIVITPFVLPEKDRSLPGEYFVGRTLPKDADFFDSFDHRLFRDAYRIREEDVYDLDFLTKNQELLRLQRLAEQAVAQNAHLTDQYPYSQFINGHIPGEKALVFRQMYSVIRRIGLDRKLEAERFIFFEATPDRSTQFKVTFLKPFLEQKAEEIWAADHAHLERVPPRPISIWDAIGNRAIAFIYTNRREDPDPNQILIEQVPEIRVIECSSQQDFDQLLWSLNQPDEAGYSRDTLLLRTERDLLRLKQAMVLRDTINLNGSEESMTLGNFNVGRLLMLPTLDEPKVDLIDGRVAHLSLTTDRYYDLLREHLNRDMEALRQELGLNEEQ